MVQHNDFCNYKKNLLNSDEKNYPLFQQLETPKIAELCLYKNVNSETKDTELYSTSEFKRHIDLFEEEKMDAFILHYGHFFNAEYADVITYIHYTHEWSKIPIYTLSPEEIIFLAIRGEKKIEDVILELKNNGTQKILGFLPISIVKSKYYSDMDELSIEDRHTIFSICHQYKISYNYPFNIGQMENETEFIECLEFVKKNALTNIVLQPNPLIEKKEYFNYKTGQLLLKKQKVPFQIPMAMCSNESSFYTKFGFPILKKQPNI